LSGSGAPGPGKGSDGDFYLDTSTYEIYGPKLAGVWSSGTSLIGPKGAQGLKGDTGAAGAQGVQGLKGDTGAQGIQGVKGEAGAQGIQGLKGETGAKGEKGEKGEKGAQGEKGEKGAQGEKGEKGAPGLGTPVTATNSASAQRNIASYGVPTADTGTNPSVTLTTGTTAMVIITGQLEPISGATAYMSFAVSGATTEAATDARALIREHGTSSSTGAVQASTTTIVSDLKAGSNTFTLQYKNSGTSKEVTFTNRTITVIPLG
jgi:hypothetical protein